MSAIEKIPTGVPGFDVISHGGIPKGRSTLVVGRSGTGKTIFGLQLAAHLARQGVKTLLVAVEESPKDLISTGDNLGLDISGALREELSLEMTTTPALSANARRALFTSLRRELRARGLASPGAGLVAAADNDKGKVVAL